MTALQKNREEQIRHNLFRQDHMFQPLQNMLSLQAVIQYVG